jgi:hypothetical protein
MGGLGLVQLGFLAAGLAVGLPILIHLLLRPRARRVEIGSLRFLRRVLKDSTRHRKLRRWLLLALRALAVVLLALLFARPYFSRAGTEGRDREVIVLIDQSASMAVAQGGGTHFARAQEAAQDLLKNLPPETQLHVAYFDDQGVYPAQNAGIDAGRRPGFAGTDFGLALAWARDLLVLSTRNAREVHLVTDLQRYGLRRTSCEGFPADVPVEVVEIGNSLVSNLSVDGVETPLALIRADTPVVVAASIFNNGALPAHDVEVRLVVEGQGAKVQLPKRVSLRAASREQIQFPLQLKKSGLYRGYVEIAGRDDFPLDDRRWLAFETRPPDPILLVDGEPGPSVYGNETYYLEMALRLALPGKSPSLTPYEPERLAWGGGIHLPNLAAYRVVVLCNVEHLEADDIGRLQAFVSQGGNLLIFTGKQVRPVGYEPLRQAGLLGAKIEENSDPEPARFDTWDSQHPIFRPLSDPQQGDLRRISFRQITRLKPEPSARVLAAAQNGAPFLIESKRQRGTILVFASSADRDWSDWPQSRLYVPLIHQLVGYLSQRLPENQRVRKAAVGPGSENPPGIKEEGNMLVVRNLDPRESEVERATPAQLRSRFHLAEGQEIQSTASGRPAPPLGSQRPDELWIYVVGVLLVVLVAELFLANRTVG